MSRADRPWARSKGDVQDVQDVSESKSRSAARDLKPDINPDIEGA